MVTQQTSGFEDIDFTDDLFLLSQKMDYMKDKLHELDLEGKTVGLKIYREKAKELRLNTRIHRQLILNGKNHLTSRSF